MTGVTLQAGVCSGQCELRFFVMVEAPESEAVRVVTARAIGTKPALVMLILVTTLARPRGIFVSGCAVAFFARHCGVEADKRKTAEVVIEGDFLAPSCFIVTAFATLTKLAAMGIVFLVTSDAGRRQLFAIEITPVACIAFYFLVPTPQWEFRRFGVVKADGGPLLGRMTRLAFGSVAAAVGVLGFVAIDARAGQILVAFARVTDGALNVFVSTLKREFGFGVIESPGLAPAVFTVATGAIFAELAFVRLVFFMASDTG